MIPPDLEPILAILTGVGLSASCGFRVFLPFFLLSLASYSGHVTLSQEFQWLHSPLAFYGLLCAMILEILAFLIPGVDNALDTVATPVATCAGVLATASVITGMDPFLKWTISVIAGGGAALSTQTITSLARLGSSALTAGIGNPLLNLIEVFLSGLFTVVALFIPLLILLGLLGLGFLFFALKRRNSKGSLAIISHQTQKEYSLGEL